MITPLIRRLLVASAILGLTGVGFFVSNAISGDDARDENPRLADRSDAEEWLFRQRSYPTGTIPAGAVEKAWRDSMDAIATDYQLDTPADYWTNIGPAPVLGGQIEGTPQPNPRVTGRVLDIAVHNNQPGHWFVATAGGIWETTTSGDSWTAKTDAVLSLGTFTVALAQSNPQILFAATHDNSGMGVALLKSIDGGTNWTTTPEFSNQSGLFFETVEVDPNNPANVTVVTSDNGQTGGVFKSTNGGTTFGPPRLPGNGTHLAINPASFLQQYAGIRSYSSNSDARSGVWRSTDGGDKWERINGPWAQSISYAGGRVKIALAPTPAIVDKDTPDAGTAYVVLATAPQPSPAPPIPGGIWKSTNPWAKTPTWIQLPTPGGFDTPDAVLVDPTDSNVFYMGGLGGGFYRYDPTQTPDWKPIYPSTHVDQHAMAVEGSKLLLGNDGGFWTSIDRGNTWTHKNTNLSTIQFYAGSFHPSNALEALGGSQDNGTEWWTGNPAWVFNYGGDGGYSAFSTTNPDTWLVSAQYLLYIERHIGGSWNAPGVNGIEPSWAAFIAPIKRAPHSNVVVAGSNNMWKSTNFFAPGITPQWYSNGPEMGDNWWGQIGAIAFAPSDPCSLTYAYGTGSGELRLTVSGGELSGGAEAQTPDVVGPWKNLDPFNDVPGRYVKAIAFHPTNPAIIYVALSGFDASSGHIYKTVNGLDPQPRWSNVSPNKPGQRQWVDIPFNALAIDPANPNIIYAGAELGVWKSTNGGALDSWTFMGPESGMPNVPVFDLAFNPVDGHLFAFTYGRGAFKLNATAVIPTQPRLANVSTRLNVGTEDNVLIGGFIVAGPGCSTKQIILRGLGPSTGVPGHLENPYIELHRADGSIVAANDNWRDAPNASAIQSFGLQPGNDLESAILTSLEPGSYTLIVTGVKGGTGVGLFEAYDLEPTSSLKLANVSTRGFVQTQDNVMIGGFILSGGNTRVVLRGLGPSIPLDETLPDPLIELKNANGATLAINDNWRDAPNANEIQNLGLQPGNDLDSAILKTLAPGAYTVILRGAHGEIGIGLFEAYPLDI
jgi:photosystem II stability/assembly factor-like uncharacterized protein